MEANNRNRTIALAAIFQNIDCMIQIANNGHCDNHLFHVCLESTVKENSETIDEIYGGLENLKIGLTILLRQLAPNQMISDHKSKDLEVTRYGINLLYLENKLSANPQVFKKLLREIEVVQSQLEFFELTHTNTIARLADIYTKNISQLGPKIMVKGNQDYLSNPDNAAKIRALLLSGIRAALLWKQSGGTRWKLLFFRKTIQKEAEKLLKTL